jgi:hypothetical protein
MEREHLHAVLFGHPDHGSPRLLTRYAILLLSILIVAQPVRAQDPPPRIGPIVLDFHGTVPRFPNAPILAVSRDLFVSELPGRGLGLQVGGHIYFLRWKAVTFGFGGEYAASRARKTPAPTATATQATGETVQLRATEEKFNTAGTQLSFNFGSGNGWSYISGGIGKSTWSLIPNGREPFPSDVASLKTLNYGGGARWFAKRHVAFSFDVRFYAINPGPPFGLIPGSPRTTMIVIGAGVSVK